VFSGFLFLKTPAPHDEKGKKKKKNGYEGSIHPWELKYLEKNWESILS
jgi:hypothetical protein